MNSKTNIGDYLQRLTACIAAGLCVISGNALAQSGGADDETGALEEVVVTGFRRSLEEALDLKRESVSSVDAIVAEDIADFPDLNLAEALQRIPGIAIRRDGGEGRNITVRGLGPDFNITRVNGMEGLGTSGGTDSSGGANRSRQFDFNIFASELFNNIIIRKSSEAWVDEGAIGAVIDLKTGRPFDYEDGEAAVVNMQALYNDLSGSTDPRISALLSKTFADGTFGFLLGASWSEREIYEEGSSTVRWQTNDWASCSACATEAEFETLNNTWHPRIPRYGRLVHDQERTGINLALQWAPSDQTEFVLDVLYGRLDGTRSEQFLEALIRNEEDVMDVTAYTIDNNNNLIAGTFDNAFIRVENRIDELDSKYKQYTLSGSHDINDSMRISGLIGSSDMSYDNPVQTTMIFDNFVDGYSYDYSADLNKPAFNYGFDVTNPNNFVFTEVRDRPNNVDNDFDVFKLDFEWDLNESWTMKTGLAYKEYFFDVNEARRDTTVANILGESVPVTADLADLLTGFGSGFGLPSGTPTAWVIPDIAATAALVDLYNLPANPRTGDIRSVSEDDSAAYLQFDYIGEIGDVGLRANFGLRWYDTDVESTGILSGETVVGSNSYSDTLPSLNVALDLTDDIVLRGSYSQVITRPTLGSLTPGGSITVFGDPAISYGNPTLDPFMADAYDLAFEWYFAEGAAITVAAFWKDIDSFIARISEENVPFGELGLDCSVLDASPIEGECDTLFTVTRNVNGNGGDLSGWEVAVQTPLSYKDNWLSNFGVVANYTSVDSDVDYAAPGEEPDIGPLTGLSESSWNLTLYYETERFSARVSGNYRDEFLIRYPDRGVNDATFWDFSSWYNINENWQVTFEVVNITDEFFDQVHIDGEPAFARPYVYHHTGRNYFLGLRWQR